jgi:hypothetical protein
MDDALLPVDEVVGLLDRDSLGHGRHLHLHESAAGVLDTEPGLHHDLVAVVEDAIR